MNLKHLIITLCITNQIFAQNKFQKNLTFSAYGELYFSYDMANPKNHEKSNFIYNHKRQNELNLNLILLKTNYEDQKWRANIGLMAGNYAQYNLSSEPKWAQNFYEANVGLKLSNKKKIWLDVGILSSHIGFEGAISADCWTLTRSILAENSPYYEAGARLSYFSKNDKLFLSTMMLNGWQHIRKPEFIQKPSFGMQATYKPTSKITFNYSNYLGTDKPDSLTAFRHFHNLYLQFEPTKKFGIIAGFDIGFENEMKSKFNNWNSLVLILRQKICNKTSVAFRAEYYKDKNQIIIPTNTANGFQTQGVSSNFDYDISEKIKCRIEVKWYNSKDKIFLNNSVQENFMWTTNLTIKI